MGHPAGRGPGSAARFMRVSWAGRSPFGRFPPMRFAHEWGTQIVLWVGHPPECAMDGAHGVSFWCPAFHCHRGRIMSPSSSEQSIRATRNWAKEVAQAGKGILKALGWFLLVCIVGGIAVTLYESYESHQPVDHDTPVWIQGDWLVGEYRVCQMRTKMQPADPDSLAKLPRLFCGQDSIGYVDFQLETNSARQTALIPSGNVTDDAFDSYFHILPVSYFGSIKTSDVKGFKYDPNGPDRYKDFIYDYDRSDKWVISWRCQRNAESLTCKSLD